MTIREPDNSSPQHPSALHELWFSHGIALLFYATLACLFLWKSLFTEQVFLPAGMLSHVAPWKGTTVPDLPWNPLRWDGIAQFYPWRLFAAETIRSGTLPLWNPYQFCGTPFVANSQSAVFYPFNLLFVLFPVAKAFGISAAIHLTFAGWFTYLLLIRLRCKQSAALLGGVIYAYSSWQVAWMQLPTFLATSCWIPAILSQTWHLFYHSRSSIAIGTYTGNRTLTTILGVGTATGLMMLAGHLQIAFYGLLVGTLFLTALAVRCWKPKGVPFVLSRIGCAAAGLALGLMLCAPQLIPGLELSRISHRAGKPTAEGFTAYSEYALPVSGLVMLGLPEFFGGDTDPNNPYWGYYNKRLGENLTIGIRHNIAETACYVGVLPLLLGLFALVRATTARHRSALALFCGGVALLALLMALGTPVNALFYFLVPGFGQSGSPARVLVLWSLAVALLASLGVDSLLRNPPTKRELIITVGLFVFLFAFGLSQAAQTASNPPQNIAKSVPVLGEVFGRIGLSWLRLGLALAVGGCLISSFGHGLLRKMPVGLAALLSPVLVAVELFSVGIAANPTSSPDQVYPKTPGLSTLIVQASHERIFPANKRWSLYASPPAVLPPNSGMVYGLRDVQGYDSLLTGQFKAFANTLALPDATGTADASPQEVGNMVFAQNPAAPNAPYTGATFAVSLPPGATGGVWTGFPNVGPVYAGSDMTIFPMPDALHRARYLNTTANLPAWKEDGVTRVTLETTLTQPDTLLLADQFTPGWKVNIDDREVPLQRAAPPTSEVFRSVPVPAGTHSVHFQYDPASVRFGLYLACFALLLLSAGATFRLLKN